MEIKFRIGFRLLNFIVLRSIWFCLNISWFSCTRNQQCGLNSSRNLKSEIYQLIRHIVFIVFVFRITMMMKSHLSIYFTETSVHLHLTKDKKDFVCESTRFMLGVCPQCLVAQQLSWIIFQLAQMKQYCDHDLAKTSAGFMVSTLKNHFILI